jgi:hypothetical protein
MQSSPQDNVSYPRQERADAATAGPICLEQRNHEIHQNFEFWNKKAVVRKVYSQFYRQIAARVSPAARGLTVELGSGMGNIKEHVPDCVTTDIFPNPWLDRVEDAYQLSSAMARLET